MHRRAALALAAVALGTTACAALPAVGPGAPSPPASVAAVGTDGIARVRLDHRSGDSGAPPVVVVPRGGPVELVVGSDTAERVLVSGVDQIRYVTAGGTVTLRFVPPAPGPMTVRLGGSGVEIGRLDAR